MYKPETNRLEEFDNEIFQREKISIHDVDVDLIENQNVDEILCPDGEPVIIFPESFAHYTGRSVLSVLIAPAKFYIDNVKAIGKRFGIREKGN